MTTTPRPPSHPLGEDLLRRLVDGSVIAIQVWRLEDPADLGSFRFVEANPASARHAGVPYERVREDLGKTFRECVPAILSTEAPARYKRVLETGQPDTLDLRYGDETYPSAIYSVHAWALDARTVALAFTNVTQQREMERQLDEKIAALHRANEDLATSRSRQVQVEKLASLGQMSAGIAHEINNPLLVVKGYTAQLRELLAAEHLVQRTVLERFLSRIERSCSRIEVIVNRMSGYSRHADRATAPLHVNSVIEETAELLRPQLAERGIELVLDLALSDPQILGNDIRLEQLVVNLLLNARDAILEAARPVGRIAVSSHDESGTIRLKVRDNGTGITDRVMAKMFDPFFSTKPPGSGTGLGLSIVHEIAQELNGQIDCTTVPGEGTTFTLSVPPSAG